MALDVDEVLCRTAEAFCTWHLGQPATDLTETGPRESRKQHFLLQPSFSFLLDCLMIPEFLMFFSLESASIYFCFALSSKESFQRCYSTDSSALRDQFLSSDFSRMADPVSPDEFTSVARGRCITRGLLLGKLQDLGIFPMKI